MFTGKEIDNIKKLSEEKSDENWKFRTFLKGCDEKKIDRIVHRLYREISSEIDCNACANCCREISPVLKEKDIKRLSRGLKISDDLFEKKYLIKRENNEEYIFNKKPCPFLSGNLCSAYLYRPDDCRLYPHLHKKDFIFRLIDVIDNCSVCPIVFNVYERLKDEVRHNF